MICPGRPQPFRSGRWGHSSAGRAPAWHAGGQRFDPAWLHHSFHRFQPEKSAFLRAFRCISEKLCVVRCRRVGGAGVSVCILPGVEAVHRSGPRLLCGSNPRCALRIRGRAPPRQPCVSRWASLIHPRCQLRARRQPAARASASEQNQRSPRRGEICVSA